MTKLIGGIGWIFGLVFVFIGCVRSPQAGQFVSQKIDFYGYGLVENDTIAITAYNKRKHSWDVLGTAKTRGSAIDVGGTSLYPWEASLDMTGSRDWPCYFHESCRFPEEGVYHGRFRLTERANALVTFDSMSDQCISEGLSDGDDAVTIGLDCAGEDSPDLWLKTMVIW